MRDLLQQTVYLKMHGQCSEQHQRTVASGTHHLACDLTWMEPQCNTTPLSKCGQWQLTPRLLAEMGKGALQHDTISLNAAIVASGEDGQWRLALGPGGPRWRGASHAGYSH